MAKIKKRNIIISVIIIAIIIFISRLSFFQPEELTTKVDTKDYIEEPAFGAGEFTYQEEELLNSIVEGRDTLTLNEWSTVTELLEKMIVKSDISQADYINDYWGKNITLVIRELNKLTK